ncbi:hypothetical protein HanPSC8_Chr14g0619451 [Helianthus annuus]|nr:hypothetical protein HanPSC8_Chr14g0619451 [Helianthus annuus]
MFTIFILQLITSLDIWIVIYLATGKFEIGLLWSQLFSIRSHRVSSANGSRTPITPCQAFSVVNGGQDPGLQSGRGSIVGSDCGGMEFTREEVDALLNTKIRTKDKFNLKFFRKKVR